MLAAATRLGPYEILAPLGAGGMVYPELARSWAWNNRLAEVDWGERAVTETARVTRTVIEAFYGIPPRRSYFTGASTVGRMAAMEAQLHPEDFDGIVSAAPALDYPGLVATFLAWLHQANTGAGGEPVPAPAGGAVQRDWDEGAASFDCVAP